MNRHPHPYRLWDQAKPLRPLLLIPVIRLLYSRITHTPVSGLWQDVLLAAVILSLGLWAQLTVTYRADDREISLRERIPLDRTRRILPSQIVSVGVERTPFMALTGGRRVRIHTGGCSRPLLLYLDRKSTRLFWSAARRPLSGRVLSALIWALSGSDAAVGWLYAVVPLRQTARFLGREPAEEWHTLRDLLLTKGLPSLLTALAVLIAVGWGLSFFRRLIGGLGFFAEWEQAEIQTRSGVWMRRCQRLFCAHIRGIVLRQTLGLSLCRRYSAAAVIESAPGRLDGNRPVICQTAARRELPKLLAPLFPVLPPLEPTLLPDRRGRRRYRLPPLLWCLPGLLLLSLGRGTRPAGGLWLILTLWWLAVRLRAGRMSGIAVTASAILLRFPKKLSLTTVLLPVRGEESLIWRQSPWQRRAGLCDVTVCVGGGRFRVRALRADAARRLLTGICPE